MPSALAFIGGGLLEGVGKGLVLAGKEKREAALKRIEREGAQIFALELEGVRQEGRTGLLGQRLKSDRALASQREAGADKRLGVTLGSRADIASRATASQEGIASRAAASRKEIGAAANLSRERAAGIKATKTDTTAAEDRIIERNLVLDEFGQPTSAINHEAAARDLEEQGFKKAAASQRRKAKGIADLDLRRRAEEFADQAVEEQDTFLSSDDVDFKDDGGSRTRFRARMVREFIAKNSGQPAPAPATRPAETKPPAPAGDPYTGETPPPGFPNARRSSKDGFWYFPDPERPGKFRRVLN